MTHSKTSKFFLPRYDPSTAKPGFFFTQVVGESMNLRMLNAPGVFTAILSTSSKNPS
jgi:hypothetical protein